MHDRVGSSLFHQSWNQALYIRLMSNPSPGLSIENLNRFEVHHGSKFQPNLIHLHPLGQLLTV